ncbi:DegT/DnrJ/EryC1/StrS family aminotransferase [Kiritimatiellaeota bacterium B1221]|nr:DegT/DnrJ/EryC1/StrS family aminotransferase [Kiritimatiellaeota bacterium B1221]
MKKTNVTEPFLPPLEEYVEYLKGIWERNWLTNQGPLVAELERKLQVYHQIKTPVHCITNGAMGLSIALRALGVEGEVITTPFSYVATTSCPLWQGCTVKFADIEEDTLTIDPRAVEAAITPKTEAILATHVFGNPCDVEELQKIAEKHHVALIYDAAHAFGVTYKGKSILEYGDASMVSMHATKLFHTVEGGFMVAKDPAVSEKMEWMRRFGHNGPEKFHGIAINAKMSEFHAAMGLCNFNHIDEIVSNRKEICQRYNEELENKIPTSEYGSLTPVKYRKASSRNYSYYPVLFKNTEELLSSVKDLNEYNIFPRRYFHPSLSQIDDFDSGDSQVPTTLDIANRILCLPLSNNLKDEDLEIIIKTIKK